MKKYIIIGIIIFVLIVAIIGLWIYGNSLSSYDASIDSQMLGLYNIQSDDNTIKDNNAPKEDVKRKQAYYDENGFVNESLYIDCQIYCTIDNDNVKSAVDSRVNEIKEKILEDQNNTSGMVVINVSGNTGINEKLNILVYKETFRRYKMLKTYFDETFNKDIMIEANKKDDSNIFYVDLENNKNISYTNDETIIYYSIKTGQKLQNISDYFSADYDFSSVIKERLKYMLDMNVGYSDAEIEKRVNDAYGKMNVEIDLFNEKIKISVDDDGFEMFFNEFDTSKMTIYK